MTLVKSECFSLVIKSWYCLGEAAPRISSDLHFPFISRGGTRVPVNIRLLCSAI